MPKKIKFESFKYRFLMAAQDHSSTVAEPGQPTWDDFIRALKFTYKKGLVDIEWEKPRPGSLSIPLDEAEFYVRGDNDRHITHQRESGFFDVEDPIKLKNNLYFKETVMRVIDLAGFKNQ